MALQLRMTHSLGQRLVEVEARSADQPIVVGRASNAEVQIPSASIAKRHCVLFVHEGRWVLQDAESPSGTYLNGERLTEPAFVNSGDVISLGRGSNPPTLTVDPHSVGVSEERPEVVPAGKAAVGQASVPWTPPVASMPAQMPPPLMPPPLIPPQVQVQGFVQDDDNIFGAPAAAYGAPAGYGAPGGFAAQGSIPGYGMPAAPAVDEWGTTTGAPAKPRRRVVKQQGTSGTTVAITAVVAMVILIGGGALIYHNYEKSKEVHVIGPPPSKPAPAPQKSQGSGSIFDAGVKIPDNAIIIPGKTRTPAAASTREATPAPKPAAPTTTGSAATPEMEPAVDKRREDPEWDEVEAARRQNTPVIAILKYDEYASRHPESPNQKDIDRYIDQAVDLIWWTRISELFEQRDNAQKEIDSYKADIAASKDAEFKKEYEGKVAKATETRNAKEAIIRTEMKFTGQVAPNIFDDQDLAIARKTRDAEYYEKNFKPRVLSKIRGSRQLPWTSR